MNTTSEELAEVFHIDTRAPMCVSNLYLASSEKEDSRKGGSLLREVGGGVFLSWFLPFALPMMHMRGN